MLIEDRTAETFGYIDACADMLGDVIGDMHPSDPTARKIRVIAEAIKAKVAELMPKAEMSDEEFLEFLNDGAQDRPAGNTTTTW